MRKTPIEMTRKNAIKLMSGDNMELLKKMPDSCIDSIVTDGPYGLSFMQKRWDYDVPSVEFWKEIYRVLKPGGHVLSFGGTRTYHRMAVNIEDAGFEIRDQIMWLYGSGFPKSQNIGKEYDKKQGNKREVVGTDKGGVSSRAFQSAENTTSGAYEMTKGTSEWEGWGTALKPANEPICVARKPLSEKTILANVLKWGTGGLNIDGCRVEIQGEDDRSAGIRTANFGQQEYTPGGNGSEPYVPNPEGRFPANLILDEEAGQMLDEQSGDRKSSGAKVSKDYNTGGNTYEFAGARSGETTNRYAGENGGASRFFYCAKVGNKERTEGLEKKSDHPTMKPIALMAYLCRLVTPKQGLVLDPFMGSGSTGCAAIQEGFRFAGMELDAGYFEIAKARIEHYYKKTYENGNDE